MTVPGVGVVTALAFRHTIDDPRTRYPIPKSLFRSLSNPLLRVLAGCRHRPADLAARRRLFWIFPILVKP